MFRLPLRVQNKLFLMLPWLSSTRHLLPLYISIAINIKRAKVYKLHEDLVRSEKDFVSSFAP